MCWQISASIHLSIHSSIHPSRPGSLRVLCSCFEDALHCAVQRCCSWKLLEPPQFGVTAQIFPITTYNRTSRKTDLLRNPLKAAPLDKSSRQTTALTRNRKFFISWGVALQLEEGKNTTEHAQHTRPRLFTISQAWTVQRMKDKRAKHPAATQICCILQ